MPSVPLTYVIGTVGLLVILGIVSLISTTQGISLQGQSMQSSLADASQYVSNEISSLVATIPAGQTGTIYFKLILPSEVNLRGYAINLSYRANLWQVVAYVPNNPSLLASTPLAFQPGTKYSGQGFCIYIAGSNSANCPAPPKSVNALPQIYSGDSRAIVWAVISNQSIVLGIGDMS
ncbi:MAG: hypothetical protein QXV32_05675 [Conexivisphaerales archaeon]